jgi:hypothetical protein
MRETSATHAGSAFVSAVVWPLTSEPVVKMPSPPSIAHPASMTPASTSACEEARLKIAMNQTPEDVSLFRLVLTRRAYLFVIPCDS